MLLTHSPIRPTPGAFATSCDSQREKRLIKWLNHVMLPNDRTLLGEVLIKSIHLSGRYRRSHRVRGFPQVCRVSERTQSKINLI